LPKRLSHTGQFSLAWDVERCKSIQGLQPNFNYLLSYMTYMTPSDSCCLTPDINTIIYLLTLPGTLVLDKILHRVLEL